MKKIANIEMKRNKTGLEREIVSITEVRAKGAKKSKLSEYPKVLHLTELNKFFDL